MIALVYAVFLLASKCTLTPAYYHILHTLRGPRSTYSLAMAAAQCKRRVADL